MKELMPMMRADLSCGLGLRFWLAVALVPFLIVADNFVDMMGMYSPSVFYMHYGSFASGGLYGTYLVYMVVAPCPTQGHLGGIQRQHGGQRDGPVRKADLFPVKNVRRVPAGGDGGATGHALRWPCCGGARGWIGLARGIGTNAPYLGRSPWGTFP